MVAVGKPVYTELGTKAYTDTNKNIFQKMVSNVVPELTDNVVSNLFKLGNTVYLATESCFLRVLKPEDLNTSTKVDISQHINVNRLCSHVQEDHDGTGYTLGSTFTTNFKCQVIKIPPNNETNKDDVYSQAQSICSIPNRTAKCSVYTHSFGMSERFIIYIEQPFFINNMKLVTAHVKGRSLLDCMDWNPKESTRFILIDKKTGSISPIIYESETPFFFLHVINCYEEDNELVVDIICQNSPDVLQVLYIENLRNLNFNVKDEATFRRYILPLTDDIKSLPEGQNLIKTDKRSSARREGSKIIIKASPITEPNYDLPTINKAYLGKKYNYFYATGLFGPSVYHGCILKVNTQTADVITWKECDEAIPGEAVFVPRPGNTSEDDGILLAGVTDNRIGKKDFLVILDAKNLNEIARADIDAHVPHLLHALFLPSNK